MNKNNGDPKILNVFQTGQIILDFNVFPFLNTILVIDNKFDLKVFNEQTKNLEYH